MVFEAVIGGIHTALHANRRAGSGLGDHSPAEVGSRPPDELVPMDHPDPAVLPRGDIGIGVACLLGQLRLAASSRSHGLEDIADPFVWTLGAPLVERRHRPDAPPTTLDTAAFSRIEMVPKILHRVLGKPLAN